MEGFGVLGTRPQRNRNPLDIEYGPFAQKHGATSGDPRFAIFPDAETGFAAAKALLSGPEYAGLTVAGMVWKFAPPVENDSQAYLNNICEWANIQPTDMLADVLGAA